MTYLAATARYDRTPFGRPGAGPAALPRRAHHLKQGGAIGFSPLGQGMLTSMYLGGIPSDSRAAEDGSLKRDFLTDENLARVRADGLPGVRNLASLSRRPAALQRFACSRTGRRRS
jgi:hypothetical protein